MLDEANETFFVNLSNPTNADDRRRPGRRDDHRRRRHARRSPSTTRSSPRATPARRRDLHRQPQRAERPDGHGRLRHGRRHGDRAGGLHWRRPARSPSPRARPEDDHRAGQRRRARRDDETFFVNLTNPAERDDRRRPGRGHDHRRRRRAVALDRRRDGHRGQRRQTIAATFTVSLTRRAASRHGRLRHRRRHGDGAGRLHRSVPARSTFAPGETTKRSRCRSNGDTLDEANETFFVNLSAVTNATITDGQGMGTITDDDPRRRSRSTT